jgi:type I restriction enzyme S subunit
VSWPLVQIGRYAEKVRTWNPTADSEGIFRYIDLSSIDKSRKIIDLDNVAEISAVDAPSRARQLVVAGDVLVATVRPNLNGVAMVPKELNGATASTGYCILRADEKNLHGQYLYYWVQTGFFVEDMMSKATGANYPAISDKIIKESHIPLPPLSEQKRIAAILDKAYAIRSKRQQAIQLADDFLRAVFLDMFGDPVTNPKGWEVKKVSECLAEGIILQVQDGNHGNDHPKVSDFVEEGIPFVTANVVRRGQVLFDNCYYLGNEWLNKLRVGFAKPRDVLLSHKGSLGFTAVLDGSFSDYIFSPQTTYYRVDEVRIVPEYLKAYFDSMFFQRLLEKEGIQSTRAYVGITRQKELPIMLPGIQLQREFMGILAKFESMTEKVASSSNELPDCVDSLSQKAFCGEL